MNRRSTSKSAFTLRWLLVGTFLVAGMLLAFLSFAANPSGGSISPGTAGNLTWTGTGSIPSGGAESSCMEGLSCDSYKLTITGTPADWAAAQKQVHVQINWLSPSTDYDMYVHKGTLAGPVVASSGSGGTTQEQVDLNPARSSIGTGDFIVHVVYFAATQADQYTGLANIIGSGAPPVPAPTPAGGSAPRFELFNPPAAPTASAGLGRASGEPSIGIALPIAGHPEGRAMFQADVQTLRVTFNGCLKPLWENKPAPTSQVDFDPILYTDRITGRTVAHLLTFAGNVILGESSYTDSSFPDNDGEVWHPSNGTGIGSGVDHQTVGGGPYRENTVPPPPPQPRLYPRTVYYCSQALVEASCARSDDGGLNYGASTPLYTDQCGGLHGHVKVGSDGVVYVPNKGCGTQQGAIVSEDNGVTWQIRTIPGSNSAGSDPAIGVGAAGRVYFGYADGDTKAVVTTSDDHGRTWTPSLDVGAQFGINNVVFPAMVAGDNNRAVFAFLGTPTAGGLQGRGFTGVWHLYVSTTYDGGLTWKTVDATPDDPVQRGCVWLGGGANVCRNMLDFMDVQIDQEGRVLVGFSDGCTGAECIQAPNDSVGNSYTALAAIARQSSGRRLLAAFDPPGGDVATVPGRPAVSTLRNGGVVHVAWSQSDDGGSPITGYDILRGTAAGMETLLATVPGSQTRYDDNTASNPAAVYYYKVVAKNALGASCGDNEVAARYVGASTSANGYTLAADPTGDQVGGPAGNTDLDIQALSVSEPASGPNAGKLVFQLKMTDLTLIPNNRMWRIIWASPASIGQQFYVGMTKDATGVLTYEYGTVSTATVGLVLGLPTTTAIGTPDSGSYTPVPGGVISIAISKDKIGSPRPGDILGAMFARTYANVGAEVRSTNAVDSTSNAITADSTANTPTYLVTGPIPGFNSVVSRKTHAGAGAFDIPLPITGAYATEPRRSNGAHTLVFSFLNPVASVGSITATATLPGGSPQPVMATGSVGTNTREYLVELTGVPDTAVVSVTLNGVVDNLANAIAAVPVTFGALIGDTTNDQSVNAGDTVQTRNRSGQLADGGNFRSDVNLDGVINGGDSIIVRTKSGSATRAE